MHTVLVVDDTPDLCAVLARVLRRAGYEALVAPSGAEALRIAHERELSAVLVDYRMPGMDGLTALARLREIQPNTVRLLISGALDLDMVISAVNAGEISRVIAKPVRPAELVGAVDAAIATRERLIAARDERQRERERAFRDLLEADAIQLGLQPIVRAGDRSVVAFEGLLRFQPNASLRGVEDVLLAAESSGAISELGAVVARRAAEWFEVLPEDAQIFLNLHPEELEKPRALLRSLSPVAHCASRVVLEITERSSLPPGGEWMEAIVALRAAGFRVAIDDLGSGASSLAALAEMDPDVLKLDMSLVRGLDGEPRKRRVVEMLCRFAAGAGIEVVAEGIETAAEAEAATALGVDLLQGYWLGRPQTDADAVQRYAQASRLPCCPDDRPIVADVPAAEVVAPLRSVAGDSARLQSAQS